MAGLAQCALPAPDFPERKPARCETCCPVPATPPLIRSSSCAQPTRSRRSNHPTPSQPHQRVGLVLAQIVIDNTAVDNPGRCVALAVQQYRWAVDPAAVATHGPGLKTRPGTGRHAEPVIGPYPSPAPDFPCLRYLVSVCSYHSWHKR